MNDKEIVYSAIATLGPIVKLSHRVNTDKTYAIAAGHLRNLIREVSSELTDEQKHCPYCHDDGQGLGLAKRDLIYGEYHDGNIIAAQIFDGKTLILSDQLNILEELQKINYCPMCGRRLNND